MDKRYQVFVSSTFADLKNERSKVIQTIMEMACIPAGMEVFPAIDEEQFNFIKRVIDDCDYYILIIGGRYGSLSEDGLSYTEKEFDYAVEKEIKVIAFLHGAPEEIPVGKSDTEPEIKEKLEKFRKKVATHRLVKFWAKADELPGLVALNLSKTIKTYPAVGWVRAHNLSNSETLLELNELRKRNEKLDKQVNNLKKQNELLEESGNSDFAGFEDQFKVRMKTMYDNYILSFSWSEIFYIISPFLMQNPHDKSVRDYLKTELLKKRDKYARYPEINEEDFQTIKIHLSTLNLIDVQFLKNSKGGRSLFWVLTEFGKKKMRQLRSVKK